jgi:DNA-directed RNA polymerase subunit RPC12/RpoP
MMSKQNDGYDDLNLGKGWRALRSIGCPRCKQGAPYVVDIIDLDVEEDTEPDTETAEDGTVFELWREKRVYICPACRHQWEDFDEYWEEA